MATSSVTHGFTGKNIATEKQTETRDAGSVEVHYQEVLSGTRGVLAGNAVLRRLALDGTGSFEMAVDASVVEQEFQYIVPAGFNFYWHRLLMQIENGSLTDYDKWGSVTLTNGWIGEILDASDVVVGPVSEEPFKKFSDLFLLAGVDVDTRSGSPNDSLGARWTLSRSYGGPLIVESGHKISARLRDDHTDLISWKISVQGEVRAV